MMIITICMVNGTSVQKFLPPWMASLAGLCCKQKADDKDHHDSQQRKDQRIGKPSLAPVGEPQAKTHQALFPRCRVLLSGQVHIRSFRFRQRPSAKCKVPSTAEALVLAGLCPTL